MKKIFPITIALLLFVACNGEKFDSEKWKTDPESRQKMAPSLIQSKVLIGKTSKDMFDLLGDQKMYQFAEDGAYHGYVYILGICKDKTGISRLYIYFDDNNKITKLSQTCK